MSRDVVVIGSGHNGLVAAALLGKSGRNVLVLEANDKLGGMCAGYEFGEGYLVPGILQDTSTFRRWIFDGLGLESHGLRFRQQGIPILVPAEDGSRVVVLRNSGHLGAGFEPEVSVDVEAYIDWRGFIDRVAPVILQQLDSIPPELNPSGSAQAWDLFKRGVTIRRLGKKDLVELARVLPMSAADWLEDCFQSELLRSALSLPAVFGSFYGPRGAGTAANLLVHECTAGTEVEGGAAGLVRALVSACNSAGVELRTDAAVKEIRVGSGEVRGVTLASGEEIDSPLVVASCDPKQTFLGLLPRGILPLRFEEQIRSIRTRGVTAIVHLGLSGHIDFECCQGEQFEAVRICESDMIEIERAFDAVKYGRCAERPVLDIRIPTLSQPALAPEGHQVVSIQVQGVPYSLEGGWTSEKREQLGDVVIRLLGEFAPALEGLVACREVLTPVDLEKKFGLSGGHLCHGEHALDQLFSMRPIPACAQFSTPVGGLFLAGSGSHPGGGITGVPGALAARVVLAGES